MKRTLFRILLLFCLVAPFTTVFFVLKKQQKQVKREVKWKLIEGVDRNELVFLKFSKEEQQIHLNWKHAKEFEFKGEMYDVVEKEVYGDTTYYWCWWDSEETKLNKQLDQLVAFTLGNSPVQNQSQAKIMQFFKSLYFQNENLLVSCNAIETLNSSSFTNQFELLNRLSLPDSPPPQINRK